ncbi:hypothetical protein C1645_731928 [Glomus cerebriforme]|uniref:P-loop containing nucleoside triphosphate hydrolase protein n=1 Tax=Glomus cerebriforme TaxID=658196 RepID=A0A397TJK6_9GLOM|nr:hypothetical protein C1645_731928 [Glomus cerebriforme]
MAQSFYKNILSSHKVLFYQQPKCTLGNLNFYPFQSLYSKYYTNSSFIQDSTIKFLKKEIVKQLSGTVLKIIVTGVISGFAISADLFYAWYLNSHNENLLNETLEKGTRPNVRISEDKLVSRPVIVERLKKIFLPYENQSTYYVICRDHGIGKTTLIRTASREIGQNEKKGIQGGREVIYVDIPADIEAFGEAFGKALNFTFEECIMIQLRKKLLGDFNCELIITIIILKNQNF